jgi:hypothetical protein
MACRVHISPEFRLPSIVRRKLRERLAHICAVLDALDRAFLESLALSSLALDIEAWRFRYEYELAKNRLVVTEVVPARRQPG